MGSAGGDAVRRAFDVLVAGTALLLSSPLLLLAMAAVRLESRGRHTLKSLEGEREVFRVLD